MEETNNNYPLIPDAVIIYLERTFPDKYPITELSQYELGFGAGQQGVIQHLLILIKKHILHKVHNSINKWLWPVVLKEFLKISFGTWCPAVNIS